MVQSLIELKANISLEGRKGIQAKVKLACIYRYTKLKYAIYDEVGIKKQGRRKGSWLRADLLAFRLDGTFFGIEVKTGLADFRDMKSHKYAGLTDYFYIAGPPSLNCKEVLDFCKEHAMGLLILEKGVMVLKRKATRFEVDEEQRMMLMRRLIWRGAPFSRRSIPKIGKVL